MFVEKNRLNEGIEIDVQNKTVKFSFIHQDYVDTSEDNNPTVDDFDYGLDVEVWSIFKRKSTPVYGAYTDDYGHDGNPLIYALKKIDKWKFDSPQSEMFIWKQIKLICKKFISTREYDCTIIIPSSSNLNIKIAQFIKEYSTHPCRIYSDVLLKLDTYEIYELSMEPDSSFQKNCRNRKKYKDEKDDRHYQKCLQDFKICLRNMEDEEGKTPATFKTHELKGKYAYLREYIKELFTVNEEYISQREAFDGKDVIIIDDIVSRGTSIIDAVTLIKEFFDPASVTILTLLSKKYPDK